MANIQKNQYHVLIERDEDGFFVASVPSLPGCHTQARTYSELMKRTREAIQLCLEVAKRDAGYKKKINQFSYNPVFIGMELVSL